MSIIKNTMVDTGVTTYNLDLEGLKRLVAKDLDVPVEAISIDHVVNRVGESYCFDGYDVFAGIRIKVNNALVNKKPLPTPQIDSPCCGENRRQ